MAQFQLDESSQSRLDYRILRNGGVALYHSDRVIEADLAWLRSERYAIHDFSPTVWNSEDDFHAQIAVALGFPDYYGENFDAFNDCIKHDVKVPAEGGVALVFRGVEAARVDRALIWNVLDILAGATRLNLLFGLRMLTLLQSQDPRIEFDPVGAVPVMWNQREWMTKDRGL